MATSKKPNRNYLDYKDKTLVKHFLTNSFKIRRAKKPLIIYKHIVKMYNYYPNTITKIINILYKIGYWKDYLYILEFAKRDSPLSNYIYKLLNEQIECDLDRLEGGDSISTLAKWMPRQQSSFDKKLNFVETYCRMYHPESKSFSAKRTYRQTMSKLNKSIDTAEIKLCKKDEANINFKKIGPQCISNNISRLKE